MESLGTEVGQKMRCAVKAKLVELGSGNSTGYIDDELPDYVMIMVANKRSKQQMIEDLNLFLGSNTEVFVNWLHQVLQKLQEVTLPAQLVQKVSKRKSNESTDIPSKKDKKKEKKLKKSHREKSPDIPSTSSVKQPIIANVPIPSITDVFADQLIQKARKTLELEAQTSVKTKVETSKSNSTDKNNSKNDNTSPDEFDIPTITEIAENAVEEVVRRKELTELEELQKKINQAKRQLRAMTSEESEDDDFLNIKADGEEEFVEEVDQLDKIEKVKKTTGRNPSPIVFDRITQASKDEENRLKNVIQTRRDLNKDLIKRTKQEEIKKRDAIDKAIKKRPIQERLGLRPTATNSTDNIISLSAHRRTEKEIYIPAFRRKELMENNNEKNREREGKRSIINNKKDREDSKEKNASVTTSKPNIRQRIGSTVIIAPPKPEYEEEQVEVPVNSVVKIKSRPIVPKNRQANKNLLLRAVAEAQKSTAFIPPKKQIEKPRSPGNNERLSVKSSARLGRLDDVGPSLSTKKLKSNIIIEIPANRSNETLTLKEESSPEIISERGESDNDNTNQCIYIPSSISIHSDDDEDDEIKVDDPINNENDEEINLKRTQFVVTLDGMYKTVSKKKKVISTKGERDARLKARLNETVKDLKAAVSETSQKNKIVTPIIARTRDLKTPPPMKKVSKISDGFKSDEENDKIVTPIISRARDLKLSPLIKKVSKLSDGFKSDEENNKSRTPPPRQIHSEIVSNHTNSKDIEKTPPPKDRLRNLRQLKIKSVTNTPKANERKRSNVSPIRFDMVKKEESPKEPKRLRSREPNERNSLDDSKSDGESHTVTIRKMENRKYDNIPCLLSSVSVGHETTAANKIKTKERCKYFPTCGKAESCEFLHPLTHCKTFPNCKFGDKCLYLHPKCRFDLTCSRPDCNFSHTKVASAAPPLASHVVPVQNYKTITANPLPTMCKFYPNCTNKMCLFYHPKLCRFGKSCLNKIECNFYHHELPSIDKLKWISPTTV